MTFWLILLGIIILLLMIDYKEVSRGLSKQVLYFIIIVSSIVLFVVGIYWDNTDSANNNKKFYNRVEIVR